MFHWLSSYNYDFALAAVPIQVVLLAFYCSRRNLPTNASSSFLWAMVFNLVMTTADIAGCEVIAVWNELPLWVSYAVNMAFFGAFAARGWFLFDYTASECYAYGIFGRRSRAIMTMPALLVLVLTAVTPLVPTIFVVTPEAGYASGPVYSVIYVSTYFYIAFSVLAAVVCRRRLSNRMFVSTIAYNAILLVGIMVRRQFINTLVTSYFSILAILIIYLVTQNPDLFRDKKTDLFNRDAFRRIVSELIYKGTPYCCIAVSVQNYLSLKMLYGYEQMSRSLQLAGRWMSTRFDDHYVFYWGNGNYLLLGKDALSDDWNRVVSELAERFDHLWESEGTEVVLSIAAMVLTYDTLPKDLPAVMDLVNHAFDRVGVESGKGNLVIGNDLLEELARQEQVGNALAKSLKNKSIEVYLQPIYSTKERSIVGAEALARLHDPDLGFIPPDEFITVAERNGDIRELGFQIFDRVCAFASRDEVRSLGLQKINVNLSPAQCLNEDLAASLARIAKKHGVDMGLFDFEVTETSFGDHLVIQKQLMYLQEYGSTFSLDDFGTGVSNLTRLMELPVRVVKLDVGVVQSYFKGKSPILPDLVRMFKNAGMETVLEGVETREMMLRLEQMGCDYEQGYYFSRPIPPEEFISYLVEQRRTELVRY